MDRVKLADIFQDSMVLQRDMPIYIWGECGRGMELTVRLGEVEVSCTAEKECFFVQLPPMPAARGMVLSVTVKQGEILTEQEEGTSIALHDISIGDVYLASGQSNMEYFLRYEAHFDELRREPENPDIHMYNVPRIAYEGQERELSDSGYWFTKDSMAWRSFSAIGYIFAKHIQEVAGVPVGIIGCNWGGTPAAAWISEEFLQESPLTIFDQEYELAMEGKTGQEIEEESKEGWEFEDSYRQQMDWRAMMYGLTLEEQEEWLREHGADPEIPMGPYHYRRPSGLYHTMVEKIAPYAVKGVLWYQGESDDIHGDIYDKTFRALTDCWRATWKNPELPFFTVQLAPFGKWLECNGKLYPTVRESQRRAAENIPGVYMTSIMDLGMYEDIHPKEKAEIGRRLALLAMEHLYYLPVLGECPKMAEMVRRGSRLIIAFHNVGDGLALNGCGVKALKIWREGEHVKIEDVLLQKDKLVVDCGNLSDGKVLVEFAWSGYCEVNLYNSMGLPAKPFRGWV